MRISQLSERAGLPVGTVKFYLRTGLLPPGESLSATAAEYDDSHLARLRLIRALLEVGRLSHAEIQQVTGALEMSPDEVDEAVTAVHRATRGRSPGEDDVDQAAALDLMRTLGWSVDPESPHLCALAKALTALDGVGLAPTPERLALYADAASAVARDDTDWVRETTDDQKVLVAAASSVLWEAVLTSLRRLATETQRQSTGTVPTPRRNADHSLDCAP